MTSTFTETTPLLKVSEMAENLIASEIIKLSGEIKDRISSGQKIYNFTIGDFDPKIFSIPKELENEIIAAYKKGETNYPAANGIPELRKAVSRFLHTRGNLEYNENQILISGGARPLIYGAYQAIVDPGDTVVFPVPSWNNNHYCHLTRATAVALETSVQNNFMPTADDIKPHIGKANLIALCSPLNPTGTTFTRQQLKEICQLILDENRKRGENKKPVYLLYDQIYWMLTFGNTVHFDPVSLFPEMKNYTIFIDGMSKSFAATGVRVGWASGPSKLINKMRAILSHVGAWAPKAEQVACAKYLEQDDNVDQYIEQIRKNISERLNAFYTEIKNLKAEGFKVDAIAPQAAIYLTVQINLRDKVTPEGKKLITTEDATKYILDDAKLAIVPFNAFGASHNSTWYRLSVGTAKLEDVAASIGNLKNSLQKLS